MSPTAALILGIETSCDDTSVCLLEGCPEGTGKPRLHFFLHHSHGTALSKWGGVVPEIAARHHLDALSPLLKEAFKGGHSPKDLNAIAVTTRPGLLGPLLTGLNAAKTLALLHRLPLVGVHHLYAHLEAVHIDQDVPYPYLGLLVSGGHSLFYLVHSPTEFEVLGATVDDAAGEAFDKGGRLMGLPYPAGPLIDRLAQGGDEERYPFPVGLHNSGDCRLSFSGLKTALRTFLEERPRFREDMVAKSYTQDVRDLLASYRWAIVKALGLKLQAALSRVKKNTPVVVGGGVACNSRLREHLCAAFPHRSLHFVSPRFCTDNGAMVAAYGLRTLSEATPFPESLRLDALSRVEEGRRSPK